MSLPDAPDTETLPAGSHVQRISPTTRPNTPPTTVPVYDEFGRQLFVPLETWRTTMLPSILAQANNDPDQLYSAIVDALDLHLAADVRAAAERLSIIDPSPERSTNINAIVLTNLGDPAAAERLLSTYVAQHGPSSVILTNLAKALTDLNRIDEADAALWRALEADPNQDNALTWYAAIQRDRRGPAAWDEAMQAVAALPNAWRPQVWLARSALDRNQPAHAIVLYQQALDRAGSPAPTVLLQSMSGDLGKHGLLTESLDLTRPAYDAKFHGLAVGNNLIKAALESGHPDQARAFVDELYQQHRPDWADTLLYWESEIKRQQLSAEPPTPQPTLTSYSVDGPLWLPEPSPFRALFPTVPAAHPKIAFLGSTLTPDPSRLTGAQLPDRSGRLTRALPLFLAESAFLHLQLNTTTIVPWVATQGFALLGAPWSDADALEYARINDASAIVLIHLIESDTNPTLTLRVLALSTDTICPLHTIALETTAAFTWDNPQQAALSLWTSLQPPLNNLFNETTQPAAFYTLPTQAALGNYLLRLEQLLAVRSSNADDLPANFLTGELEIIRGQLDLAISAPQSFPARLILLATLRAMQKRRPEIVAEFLSAAELLQQRYPLSDPQANTLLAMELQSIDAPAPMDPGSAQADPS
jgi:tetratricopeptide (TPR) repeat protein